MKIKYTLIIISIVSLILLMIIVVSILRNAILYRDEQRLLEKYISFSCELNEYFPSHWKFLSDRASIEYYGSKNVRGKYYFKKDNTLIRVDWVRIGDIINIKIYHHNMDNYNLIIEDCIRMN